MMSVNDNPESNPPVTEPANHSGEAVSAETATESTATASTVTPAEDAPSATAETAPATPETASAPAENQVKTHPPTKKKKAPLPRIGGAKMGGGPLSARGQGVAKPQSPAAVSTEDLEKAEANKKKSGGKPGDKKKAPRPRLAGETDADVRHSTG